MDYLSRKAVYDSYDSIRSAKDKTIKTLGRIGRKYKRLKWPIFAVSVLFIFLYNLFYHFFLKFEMKQKLASALSFILIFALVITGITVPVAANEFSKEEITEEVTAIESLGDSILNQKIEQGLEEQEIILPDSLNATVMITTKVTSYVSKNESEENFEDTTSEGQVEEVITDDATLVDEEETNVELSEDTLDEEEPASDEETPETPEETPAEAPEEETPAEAPEAEAPAEAPEAEVPTEAPEVEAPAEAPEVEAPAEVPAEEPENLASIIRDFFSDVRPIKAYAEELEEPAPEALSETPSEDSVSEDADEFDEVILYETSIETRSLNVTWKLNKEKSSGSSFSSENIGDVFVYDAILSEEINLASGISLPSITVEIVPYVGPAFESVNVSDGVKVTVKADPGVFPENSYVVVRKAATEEEMLVEEAVSKLETEDVNLAKAFTFDITVFDSEGNIIEPDNTMGEVSVSFELAEVEDVNLETSVYHVSGSEEGLLAEELAYDTNGAEITAQTTGFSYYSVRFSYGSMEYLLAAGDIIELSKILSQVKLSGTVSNAVSNQPGYMAVYKDNGVWYVEAVKEFDTTVNQATLTVTINGTNYVITVKQAEKNNIVLGTFDYETNSFSKASGAGTGKYISLSIFFTTAVSSGTEIMTLPTVSGYTVKSKNKNVTYEISFTDKTPAQVANEYIRKIKFNDYKDKNISLSFELATAGAQLKQNSTVLNYTPIKFSGNDHYYVYIPYANNVTDSWKRAYDAAQTMTYAGRTGYLATITSKEEDMFVKEQSGGKVGWLGGTTASINTDGSLKDINTESSCWHWVCGPEKGQVIIDTKDMDGISNQSTYYAQQIQKGYYFNWNSGEPNHDSDTVNCLTTLMTGTGYSTKTVNYSWNDIVNDRAYDATYAAKGYMVEFGDLKNGDTHETADLIKATSTISTYNASSIKPSIKISDGALNKSWNTFEEKLTLSDFLFYDSVPTVTITPTNRDAYVSEASYYVSDKPLTQAQLDGLNVSYWTPYKSEFPFATSGVHIVYSRYRNLVDYNFTYTSSQPFVVSEDALTAWFIKDSEGNIVGFGYGSLDDVIDAGLGTGYTIEAVVRENKAASTTETIPDNVEISIPANSSATVAGDTVENTSAEGTYVVLENSNSGLLVTAPAGGNVSVNDADYANASTSENLVVTVDNSDNVILTDGQAQLDKGETINVVKDGELVKLENTSTEDSDNTIVVTTDTNPDIELSKNASLTVSNGGETSEYSGDGNASSTLEVVEASNVCKVTEGNVNLSEDNKVYVGDNNVVVTGNKDNENPIGVSANGDILLEEEQSAKVGSTTYTAAEDNTKLNATEDANLPVLEEGSLVLGKDTSVAVNTGDSSEHVIFTTVGENNPVVHANGDVDVENESKIIVKDETTNKENTIEVGEGGTENGSITVSAKEDGTVDVSIQSGDTVSINDNVYVGAGEENASATVNVDLEDKSATLTEGDINLSAGSAINVSTGEGEDKASTKVVANNENTPTVSADGTVVIPEGGKVTATTETEDEEGQKKTDTCTVESPESSGEPGTGTPENAGTTIQINGGNIEVELKEDESVKVNDSEITAKSDDTTLSVNEDGATLTSGSIALDKDQEVVVNGSVVTNSGENEEPLVVSVNPEEETTTIDVQKNGEYTVRPVDGTDEDKVTFKADEDKEETEHVLDKFGNFIVDEKGLPIAIGEESFTICSEGEDKITVKITPEGVDISAEPGDKIIILDKDGNPSEYVNAGGEELELVLDDSSVPTLKKGSVNPAPGLEVKTSEGVIITNNENNPEDAVTVHEDGTAEIKKDAIVEIKVGSENHEIVAGTDTKVKIGKENVELEEGEITVDAGLPVHTNDRDFSSPDGSIKVKTENGDTILTTPSGKTITITDNNGKEVKIKNNGSGEGTYKVSEDGTVELSDGDEIFFGDGTGIVPGEDTVILAKDGENGPQIKVPSKGGKVKIGGLEIVTESDDTKLSVEDGNVILEDGSVSLNKGGDIVLKDKNGKGKKIKNTSEGEKTPVISMDTDGEGQVFMPEGTEISLSNEDGSAGKLKLKNSNDNDVTLDINDDGTVTLNSGDKIDCVIDGKEFEVSADGSIKIENSADGAKYTIPSGKTITIYDLSQNPPKEIVYTNNGSSDLVIDMDKDGDIALINGELGLASGETIYMSDGKGNQIPVKADGDGIRIDSSGNVVLTEGTSVSIDGKEYKGSTESGDKKTKLSMKEEIGIPVLVEGELELGEGAAIGVYVDGKIEEIVNTSDKPVSVDKSGNTEIPAGGSVSITVDKGEGKKETETVSLPESATEGATVKTGSDGKITLDVPVNEETGIAQIVINGATYTAEGELEIVTDPVTGENTLGEGSTEKVSVENGSLTVGDTTVTAQKDKPVTVTRKDDDSVKVEIPAGSSADITVKDASGEETTTKVEVPANAENPLEVETLTGEAAGKLGVSLEENETVIIDGGEVKAVTDGTQISFGEEGAILEDGEVSLGEDAGIIVNGSKIENSGDGNKPVDVTKNEEGTTITVAPGGSYKVSENSEEAGENTYEFVNTGSTPSSFDINEEGEIEVPAETKIPVSVNGGDPIDIYSDGEIEVKIGEEGIDIRTPAGNEVSVGDNTYVNTDDTKPLDLVINEEGDVVLKEGSARVEEGSELVIVKENSDPSKPETQIEIKNNGSTNPGEPAPELEIDEEGNVKASEGASFDIVTKDSEGNTVKDSYVAKEDGTEIVSAEEGNTLVQGSVGLEKGSNINVNDENNAYNISNSGSAGEVSASIGGDGKISIEVDAGGTVVINNEDENLPDLSFTNRKDNNDASYEIQPDGSIKANAGDSISASKDGKTTVINPQGEAEIIVMPTEEGLDITLSDKGDAIRITEETEPGKKVVSVITAESDNTSLTSTEEGTKLNEGTVSIGEKSSVIVGDTKISNQGSTGVEITAPDSEGKGGKIKLSEDGSVYVGAPGENGGGYTFSVPEGGTTGTTTLDMTEDGGIKVPAGSPVTVSTGSGSGQQHTISTGSEYGEGLVFEATDNGPKITVGPGETLVIDGKEYKNTDSSNPSVINLTQDGKVVVVGGGCKVPAGETVYIEETGDDGEKILVDVTVPKVEPQEGETVTGGDVVLSVSTSPSGEKLVSTKVSPQIIEDEFGNVTVEDATVEVGGATYVAKNSNGSQNDLSITTNTSTGEAVLAPECLGTFEVTNGNLTIGTDTFTCDGDNPIEIKRPSSLTTPSVSVPAGGNVTIEDKNNGTGMEIFIPEDAQGPSDITVNRQDGVISTTLGKGETITIGGVEYTSKDGGKLSVDAQTGKLDKSRSTVTPDMRIDPARFNKENYEVEVGKNQTVTVGNTTYSSTGESFTLTGNPEGNPVINVGESGETVKIGEKEYTTSQDDTCFSVADNGDITLEGDNGGLLFDTAGTVVVDGIKYTSNGEMTIGKEDGKTVCDTGSGTDVTVILPKGSKVTLKSEGAEPLEISAEKENMEYKVKTSLDENGNTVIVADEVKKPTNANPVYYPTYYPEEKPEEAAEETASEKKVPSGRREAAVSEPEEEPEEIQMVVSERFEELSDVKIEKNTVQVDLGEGSIKLYTVEEGGSESEDKPAILEGNLADIIRACLDEEEIQMVCNGANIEIRLTVEKDTEENVVTQDEKQAIREAVEKYNKSGRNYVIGVFADISLQKNVNAGGWSAIHEAGDKLRIVLEIPEEIIGENRTYYVLRKHENEYEILMDVDVVDNTITFLSDRFSTYAILYTENETKKADTGTKVEKTGIEPEGTLDAIPEEPEKHCRFPWWIILVILILLGGGYWYYKKKKENKEE